MAEQEVVRHLHGCGARLQAWCKNTTLVAQNSNHPGFVVRGVSCYTVAQTFENFAGVIDKVLNRVAVGPAALVLQGLRQVPMIERDLRRNAFGDQSIHQLSIKIQTGFVERTLA